MGSRSKIVALALLGVMLAVPVSAWAACDAMLREACKPMPCHSESAQHAKLRAANGDCCAVGAPKNDLPTPAEVLPRGESAEAPAIAVLRMTAPVVSEHIDVSSSPPPVPHTSQSLLCTFLI